MEEITVVKPVFVADFKCVGSECPDHCCKEWNISLDKKTVSRYLNSAKIEIRNIASENITITKKSPNEWGAMKFAANGNCAFMDDDKLCKVHKTLGEKGLSSTCSTYPRKVRKFSHSADHSVMISCPEAAKQLLTRPDSMLFQQTSVLHATKENKPKVNQEHKLINLMSANLIKFSQGSGAVGLYSIAMLFMHMEKINHEGGGSIERLESYYLSIVDSIASGSVARSISGLKNNYELQWALLLRLQTYFSTKVSARSVKTLRYYINKLVYIQTEGAKEGDVASSMARLNNAWNEKVIPWLAERPHLMSNYLQYRIYHDNFPGRGGSNPLACLYLLSAEWFFIKSLIAACVELVGYVEENDVINIIYSFHSLTTHTSSSSAAFCAEIDKVKVNDDLSLIYLLK